jgi:hypothetical protein
MGTILLPFRQFEQKAVFLYNIMMYEVMAIVTEPCQIGNSVIQTILIDVMNRQNPLILASTQRTNLTYLVPTKHTPIYIPTIFPICMLRTYILLIPPFCLTRFTAKKLTTL